MLPSPVGLNPSSLRWVSLTSQHVLAVECRRGKLNSQFVRTISVLHAGGRSLFRFHIIEVIYSYWKPQTKGCRKQETK